MYSKDICVAIFGTNNSANGILFPNDYPLSEPIYTLIDTALPFEWASFVLRIYRTKNSSNYSRVGDFFIGLYTKVDDITGPRVGSYAGSAIISKGIPKASPKLILDCLFSLLRFNFSQTVDMNSKSFVKRFDVISESDLAADTSVASVLKSGIQLFANNEFRPDAQKSLASKVFGHGTDGKSILDLVDALSIALNNINYIDNDVYFSTSETFLKAVSRDVASYNVNIDDFNSLLFSNLKSRIFKLEKTLEQNQQSQADLNAKLIITQNEISLIRQLNTDAEATVKDLNRTINELKVRNKTLSESNGTLQNSISQANKSLNSISIDTLALSNDLTNKILLALNDAKYSISDSIFAKLSNLKSNSDLKSNVSDQHLITSELGSIKSKLDSVSGLIGNLPNKSGKIFTNKIDAKFVSLALISVFFSTLLAALFGTFLALKLSESFSKKSANIISPIVTAPIAVSSQVIAAGAVVSSSTGSTVSPLSPISVDSAKILGYLATSKTSSNSIFSQKINSDTDIDRISKEIFDFIVAKCFPADSPKIVPSDENLSRLYGYWSALNSNFVAQNRLQPHRTIPVKSFTVKQNNDLIIYFNDKCKI